MANDKMTNAKALAWVLENCDLPTDVAEKITNIHTSTVNKATNRKPTAKQNADAELSEAIFNLMEIEKDYQASELVTLLGNEDVKTTQRMVGLLKPLIDSGRVEREKIGKKTVFRVIA